MKTERSALLWPILLGLVYLLMAALTIDTQPFLSPDDHGKDLYAFAQFLKGGWPCRDYWWQYGPLMLFYYGFWLKVIGTNMISIRIGVALLYLLSALFTYRALRIFTSRPVAFLASLILLIPWLVHPYYNFNHLGAPPLILLSLFCLWKFFVTQRWRWAYGGMLALAALAWIKIVLGVSAFLAFSLSLLFYLFLFRPSFPRKHLLILPALFALLVAGPYLVMYSGYSTTYVDQCLGIRGRYHVEGGHPRETPIHLALLFFVWQPERLWWLGLFLVFAVLGFLGLGRRIPSPHQNKILVSAMVSLLLYELGTAVMEYHFLVQSTRFDFWSLPIFALFLGLAANEAKNLFSNRLQIFLGLLLSAAVLFSPVRHLVQTLKLRTPERYLDFDSGKVYLTHQYPSTVESMKKVSHFLAEKSAPGDSILVLPIGPLFNFLSGRDHAVRELYFGAVGDAHLAGWQEERVIREIDAKKVPYVVLFRLESPEPGWGKFGVAGCHQLAQYLKEHYEEAEMIPYGPENDRGYIKIFQRI